MTEIQDVYDAIVKVFGRPSGETNWRTIQRQIRRKLRDLYGILPKEWNTISPEQQNLFLFTIMKDYLFKKGYCTDHRKKQVEQQYEKIYKMLNEALEMNQLKEDILIQYYDESDSLKQQRKKYNEFVKTFKKSINFDEPPTFESWKNNPLRVYDYIQSYRSEIYEKLLSEDNHSETSIPESKICRTAIEALCKSLNKKIDFAGIESALDASNYMFLYGDEPIQLELDKDSNIPENRQNEIISNNIALLRDLKRLEELDFVTDLNESAK